VLISILGGHYAQIHRPNGAAHRRNSSGSAANLRLFLASPDTGYVVTGGRRADGNVAPKDATVIEQIELCIINVIPAIDRKNLISQVFLVIKIKWLSSNCHVLMI